MIDEEQEKINKFVSDKMNMLMSEPVYRYRKSSVLKQTESFNQSKIQQDISRSILIKLLYLINKGEIFQKTELEELSIRVTKLFQFQNPELRRLIYKLLKIIMPSNIQHVITQSIYQDLSSSKLSQKINGLKMIDAIKDQSRILWLERFVKDAILDHNEQISNLGLLISLKIFESFPKLVQKWSSEILFKLKESQQSNKFYALISYYKVQQDDMHKFIKILQQIIYQKLTPITNMQVLRLIESIMYSQEKFQMNLFVEYSLSQIVNKDPIIFFQASKIIIDIRQLANKELQPMMSIMLFYLCPQTNNIYTYTAIRILNRLIINCNRQQLITDQILETLQQLTFSNHIPISSLAIQFCISINKSFNSVDLAQIYQKIIEIRQQKNFLQGLNEFLNRHQILGDKILQFIQIILQQDVIDDLVFENFDIVVLILKTQRKFRNQSIGTILWMVDKFKIITKQRALQEIYQILIQKPYIVMERQQIDVHFQNLVKQYKIYEPNNYIKIECNFIKSYGQNKISKGIQHLQYFEKFKSLITIIFSINNSIQEFYLIFISFYSKKL